MVAGDAGRKDAAGAATGYPFHPPESGRCEGHGWCRVSDGFHLLTWISGGEVRGGVGLEIDEEAGGGALDSVEKLEVLGDGVSGFVEIVDFELDDDVVEAGGGVDGGDGGEGGCAGWRHRWPVRVRLRFRRGRSRRWTCGGLLDGGAEYADIEEPWLFT